MNVIPIVAAVEGPSDEGAVASILTECGFSVSMFQRGGGRTGILKKAAAYNAAAKISPWFVLVDLDSPSKCVVEKLKVWMPSPSDMMVFRVAVPELESWLLADREAAAHFLGVAQSKVPRDPDTLDDPKQEIINLARGSRKREIREGLVPRVGASLGPTYVSDISKFGREAWRPRIAAEESPSLRRCMRRLDELAERLTSA